MFLHGWGSNKDAFILADEFLKGFTVTRVDLFGFGKTPPPAIPVDLDYYVAGVRRLMEFYKMENVVVVGHSFGGRVAIKLAESSRVAALILTDAAGLKPRRRPSYYFKVLSYKIKKALGFSSNSGSSDYRALTGAMKGTFVKVVNEYLDGSAAKITCPTLLRWGENDAETPLYMYKRCLRLIASSRGVIMENAGHFPFLDDPKRYYTLVKQFAITFSEVPS